MPGYELIGKEERNAAMKIFDEGGVLFHRSFENIRKHFYVREFNNKCQKYFNSSHCSAVSSGTAAIKCALKAAGVKSGDEVVTQAFNFVACVEAIVDVGAKPIICNVNENLHLDIDDLKDKVTSKTKAVLVVHMLGQGGDIYAIKEFCEKNSLILIEDACEAIGGKVGPNYYGSIGDIGIFSLDFAKMITCGEGGITLTNNDIYGTYIKQYIDHGHENNPDLERGHDNRVMPGFNFRMTELQASIASVQLDKLEYLVDENRKRYMILKNIIEPISHVRQEYYSHSGSYDTFIFKADDKSIKAEVIKKLFELGFGTKILPDAMEWHCAAYWGHALDDHEVEHSNKTLKLLESSVAIPIFVNNTIEEYTSLAKAIQSIIKS